MRLDLALSWTLPGAVFHLGLDALSGCFLVLIVVVGLCAGLYGEGYLKASHGHLPAGPARVFFAALIGSMALLVAARNAVLFMVAWEAMALSAFALVSCEHDKPEVRDAGLLYLLCTHAGSLCLLALFALLGRNAGSLEFSAFASAPALSAGQGAAVLALALVGFGMKAGFMPLHIWLQEAHPAAPSHASAAMSGVMIEMGVYGLLRLLSLLGPIPAGPSLFIAGLGLLTAAFGILFALAQRDFKRLLAYSSIENIGIIAAAAGLGCWGWAAGSPALALLGFSAALLHTLNHGLFKSLLFLCAGAFYQATGTRDLEACGGLQRRMPLTGAAAAIGAAAICGLPPLNGFIGEWLIYRWLLEPGGRAMPLAPMAAAVLAIVGGLAVVALTKAYGAACLGQPRGEAAARAEDPSALMLVPMLSLAALCALLGVLPAPALRLAASAGAVVCRAPAGVVAASVEEWSGLLRVVGAAGAGVWLVAGLLWLLRRRALARRGAPRAGTWGCGFTAPSTRMQYTASSYAHPAARVFSALLGTREERRRPLGYWPSLASYASRTPDPALELWLPVAVAKFQEWIALPRGLQRGRLQSYLFYMSAFLVGILLWKL